MSSQRFQRFQCAFNVLFKAALAPYDKTPPDNNNSLLNNNNNLLAFLEKRYALPLHQTKTNQQNLLKYKKKLFEKTAKQKDA
jgi:hypothetical protein